MTILWVLVAFALLTIGAELLVRGASGLARRSGLSSFFIGLTIVGFGTSSPELLSSLTAAFQGNDAIAIGNVVGSNIFNIAVILGASALICPIPIQVRLVRLEVLIVIAVALVPAAAWLTDGDIERWEGFVFIALLVVYVARGYVQAKKESPAVAQPLTEQLAHAPIELSASWTNRLLVQLLFVIAGLALLVAGGSLLVRNAVELARSIGVSELAIGLTLVAGGTSLPELATTIVAAIRRQSDIAVGNVLGSNVFNVLGVLGCTAVVKPQTIPAQSIALDVPVMVALSVACLPIVLSHHRISRVEGGVLLLGYGGYLLVLFALAPGWFS